MRIINKTYRQIKEYNLYNKKQNDWLISKKYSELLFKNIDKINIKIIANEIYLNYLNEVKPGKNIKRENYVLIWDTMINTVSNNKHSNEKKKNSIRQLNYVNKINFI
jgi:hypothetical protein